MNRERVQRLRDYIAELPPERFCYRNFFTNPGRQIGESQAFYDFMIRKTIPPLCGTVACVAGYALCLFGKEEELGGLGCGIRENVAVLLEINGRDYDGLCVRNTDIATRQDALARLDWLLEHETLDGYDFSVEPRPEPSETVVHLESCDPEAFRSLRPPLVTVLR